MSLVGRTLGGRYKLVALLGKGGMGTVYEAEQTDLHRRVAVKVLTGAAESNDVLRFKQEALAAAGLAHPNIVQVIDFIEDDEPLLVMELLRGKTLSAIVRAEGALEPSRAVGIMTQVLSALAAAHDARIVHRDVKPENIFICKSQLPYELAKVLDFGLARPLDDELRLARTRVGVAVGTPAYMSPEQARGDSVDVRMDVFAAGVTLYYALAARRPFDGKTTSELLHAVKKQPPIPLSVVCPDLDLDLVRAVERSLSKDPAARFATARDFIEALTPHWPPRNAAAPAVKPEPPPRSTRTRETRGAPKPQRRAVLEIGELDPIALPIAPGMVLIGRFAEDGASAFAIGPTGLARWTYDTGWAGRELPPDLAPSRVRGVALAPNGEALLYGDEDSSYARANGRFTRFDLPTRFVAAGGHIDHASHAAFAGALTPTSPKDALEAVVVECSPAGVAVHPIARNRGLHAITRAQNGALVACGTSGTLCLVEGNRVHAHVAGSAAFRAVASLGLGFVAASESGALVIAPRATSDALATLTPTPFVDDALSFVRTRAKFICAAGDSIHVARLDALAQPASVSASGVVRDVWLGNGVVRVLLDTAAVLEATVNAAP